MAVDERESVQLADDLERRRESGDTLVASLLLHGELHCAANRRPEHLATARRVKAPSLVAYDAEMCAAAHAAGVEPSSPGAA